MTVSMSRVAAAMTACGLLLGGCASLMPKPAPPKAQAAAPPHAPPPAPKPAPAPAPTPVIIKVPVPVKETCVPKTFPRAPKYPDSDTALRDAGGAADRYQLMAAGRLLRDRRLAELEKVVEGCR